MSSVPVYEVSVPDYKFKRFRKTSEKVEYQATPLWKIMIPKVYADNVPDFSKFGKKVDDALKKHFLNKRVVLRTLSSQEHPDKSADDLIKIIKALGHDRYDPNIKGDRYENREGKHIDIFGWDLKIEKDGEYLADFMEPFYFWPLSQGKEPQRLDIVIIYDPAQLEIVEHTYEGRESEVKRDGFVFKFPNDKPAAILGIIKIK